MSTTDKGQELATMVLAVHRPYDGPNGYIGCMGKSCWPSAHRTTPWPCTLARAAQELLDSAPAPATTADDGEGA